MGSLVFVHGTGVRKDAYERTFATIERAIAARKPGTGVHRCAWGDTCGVRLLGGGKSIPTYDTARALTPTSGEVDMLALWSALYDDPLYELRLLALAAPEGAAAPLSFGELPVSAAVADAVATMQPDGAIGDALRALGLEDYWTAAYRLVADAPELTEALDTLASETGEHRAAIARAVVAALVADAQRDGFPTPDAAGRDELVNALADRLGGSARSLGGVLLAPLKGLALRIGTRYAMRKRGAVSDASSPVAGDILLYQTRGDAIRSFLRDALRAAPPPITVLAHSLGGIAAVDLLASEAVPGVERLITVGSQAPLFYELDVLTSLRWQDPLPAHFPRWMNVYDLRDMLSYVGSGVFPNRVSDVEVKNGQPFPVSHGAYWQNERFWAEIVPFMV